MEHRDRKCLIAPERWHPGVASAYESNKFNAMVQWWDLVRNPWTSLATAPAISDPDVKVRLWPTCQKIMQNIGDAAERERWQRWECHLKTTLRDALLLKYNSRGHGWAVEVVSLYVIEFPAWLHGIYVQDHVLRFAIKIMADISRWQVKHGILIHYWM